MSTYAEIRAQAEEELRQLDEELGIAKCALCGHREHQKDCPRLTARIHSINKGPQPHRPTR